MRRSTPLDGQSLARNVSAAGVLALTTTKAADALTTFAGLTLFPHVQEGNPLVATAIESVGAVPTLLGLSLLVIAVITTVTEAVARRTAARGGTDASHVTLVRALGYGLPSTLHVVVATHNAVLLGLV